MGRQQAIQQLRNLMTRYEPAYRRYRGWLKDAEGSGSVFVSDRPGYVYIQRRDVGGSVDTEQVRMVDGNVPDIDGFPVVIGRNSVSRNADVVLGRDQTILLDWLYDYILQSHHAQHEAPDGFDIVHVQERAIIPLRASPQLTADLTVQIYAGGYPTLEGNAYFAGDAAYDLSASVPVGGQRWVVLGINQNTGSLTAVNGTPIGIDEELATDDLPNIPCDMVTSAAIQMYRRQSAIVEENIWDFRAITGWAGSPDVYEDGVQIVDCASSLNFTGDWVDVVQDGHRAIIHIPASGAAITADAVILPHLFGSTYDDVEDWFNHTQSAGRVSGGAITDNGDGTIDVAAGTGFIKSTDSPTGDTYYFDWPAKENLALANHTVNWIYVNYNGGDPEIFATDTPEDIDRHTKFSFSRVWREDNTLNISALGQEATDVVERAHSYLVDIFGYMRASGIVTSESGADRTLDVSAGFIYEGLSRTTIAHIDTDPGGLADTFTAVYRDGLGDWTTVPGESVVSNTQYDDGTGVLGTITPNQFGVFWVYVDLDGHLFVQYGQGTYKLAEAESMDVSTPSPFLIEFAVLIARIIVERDAVHFDSVAMPWNTSFSFAQAADHGNLGGLLDDDHTQYLLEDGTRPMSGNLNMGGNQITNVGNVDGVDVSAHGTRHDVGGADPATTTDGQVASTIVATDANKGIRPARLGVNEVVPDQDGVIALGEAGADPTGGGAGTARTYFKDVGGQSKQFFMDDAGNVYEIQGIVEDLTVSVVADFATIQAAVDWLGNWIIKGACFIDCDEAVYAELLDFSGLLFASGATLTIRGDQRVLAGLSYVDTHNAPAIASMNLGALANGGSGICTLATNVARDQITITGSVANPDFDADGWGDGDWVLVFADDGVQYEREINSIDPGGAGTNVIELKVALPAGATLGNDGTAICLKPDRSIEPGGAGTVITIPGTHGVVIDGFEVEPFTNASSTLVATGGAKATLHNMLFDDANICIDATGNGTEVTFSSGAISCWNSARGVRAGNAGEGMGYYAIYVDCTTAGAYCSDFGYVHCYYSIAANCGTYAFVSVIHSCLNAAYCTVRQTVAGTAFSCQANSYLSALGTIARNNGNLADYSPNPGGVGYTESAVNFGVLYSS